ncbi:MAG: RagB/SusD family nutrient uptake outer membrane protein, partial [Prevotella sp.]|nr:RagB/SusD family nutrient uptake outer membrane protein [Prevotella sp.]
EFVKGGARGDQARTALSANFLLRTAEAYLNVAEAAAYKGDSQTALQALNTLRKNRISTSGYSDVSAGSTELINFIRDERARELCLEGHRWFDLRRYAVCSVQPYVKTIRHNYTTMSYEYSYSTWSYQWVATQSRFYELKTDEPANTLPIPKEVIDFNIGMRNNDRADRQPVEIVNY